jgi:HPt (histidine-containing phosphotransfer) domain-containing protein
MTVKENESVLVNLVALRELLGNSRESIIEILTLFVIHIPPSIDEIKELLSNRRWDDLRKKVHSVKSYYGYVGNVSLNEKLTEWEVALSENPTAYDHETIMNEMDTKSMATVVYIQRIMREEFSS